MAPVVELLSGMLGLEGAPNNLAQLIPWLFTFVLSVVLISGVFRVFGKLAELLLNWRKW